MRFLAKRMVRNIAFRGYVYGDMDARHFISLLFIAMSKEKTEDEMIMQIRLKSVFFSLWFTSVLFVVETLFFSTLPMLTVFGPLFMYC